MHLGHGGPGDCERHGALARLGAMLALVASMLVVQWGLPAPVALTAGAGADSHAGAAPPASQRELGRAAQLEVHRLKSAPSGGDGDLAAPPPAFRVRPAPTGGRVLAAAVPARVPITGAASVFDARAPPASA